MHIISCGFSKEQEKKLIQGKRVLLRYQNESDCFFVEDKNYEKYIQSRKKQKGFIISLSLKEIEVNISQNVLQISKRKGSLCSVEGNKYEKTVHQIVKQCSIDGQLFNTQNESELAGSSSKNDIVCNYRGDVNIEIKKANSPDWMQCSIQKENGIWIPKSGKNNCEKIFKKLLEGYILYDDAIPPFFEKNLTHEEWKNIKRNTNQWNDIYFQIPSTTIRQLYAAKGCHYMQISEYGLYHLGNDICQFGVPQFDIPQEIRIRTKIHQSMNRKGFCQLSIMMAAKPITFKNFKTSPYSLDCVEKLPPNLSYNNNFT